MITEKEKLSKLLKLISEICGQPQNDWFKIKLQQMLHGESVPALPVSALNLDTNVMLILRYLHIDLRNQIDYSEFKEPAREQLFRDNLEMLRFQHGTPQHKIDFGEFCRYAHLQVEEMFNYLLVEVSRSRIDLIERFIKKHNSKYTAKEAIKDIDQIPFPFKLTALYKSNVFSADINDRLWFLKYIRNEGSHRSSMTKQSDDEIMAEINYRNIRISSVRFGPTSPFSEEEQNLARKGKYIVSKRNEDFNSILVVLNELKDSVLKAVELPLKID